MELEEIKSKNLPVVETYEEFGEKLNEIDFSQEDFAALVTDLTSVLYADSLETIWGFIGFQWDEYNNYGHFNARSFEIKYIPQIPDPERIQKFPRNFISSMNDKEIIIGYNNFINLTEIDSILQDNNKDLILYTDGIPDETVIRLYKTHINDTQQNIDNHSYQKVKFIGNAEKQYDFGGFITNNISSTAKPNYLLIDDQLNYKLSLFNYSNHFFNGVVKYIEPKTFKLSDHFYLRDFSDHDRVFESSINSFELNPVHTQSVSQRITYNHTGDMTETIYQNGYLIQNAIDLTLNFEHYNDFEYQNSYLTYNNSKIIFKNIKFLNLDKIQYPIVLNNFISNYYLINRLNNVNQWFDIPFQEVLNLISENKLIIGENNQFTLSTNLELDITQDNQIILDAKNINLTLDLYYIFNSHNFDVNNPVLLPFVIQNSDNSDINISTREKIYGGSSNLDDISTYAISNCLSTFNYNITCHFLRTNFVQYYRNSNRYTATFNNCLINNWYYEYDENQYIVEPNFIYNASPEDETHTAVIDLKLRFDVDYCEQFILNAGDTFSYVQINLNNCIPTINDYYILGAIGNNTGGEPLIYFKNNRLKNNDGMILIIPQGYDEHRDCRYICFDITKWDYIYAKSIQFLTIQTNINLFYDAVMDIQIHNQAELSIIHENYIQLSSTQINHLVELGYTVIDYII